MGDSLTRANTSGGASLFNETDWGQVPAGQGYGYDGSSGGITNWRANMALSSAPSDQLMSSDGPTLSVANRYVNTFDDVVVNAAVIGQNDDNGDVQRLLARKPALGMGERIVNGVVDGFAGVVNIGQAYYKSKRTVKSS